MENSKSSFVSVLKHGNQSPVTPENSKPTLVLDESCIKEYDFGMSLIGKAKDVYAIPNLPCILSKEGFQNVKLSYLGGMWVLFELDSLASKEKFLSHTGIGSWFSDIIQATSSFVNDERMFRFRLRVFLSKHGLLTLFMCLKTKMDVIINERHKIIVQGNLHWICVKELDAWSPNFQDDDQDDLSSYEESQEDDVSNKDDKTESDVDRVSESSFMHENDFVHKDVTCSKTREVGTHSEDPFNIYGLLDGQKNKACNSGGIICVWNPNMFVKEHVSTCDYFIALMGTWTPTSSKLLIISVYAPQELNERRDLWDYLRTLIGRWEGDTVIMGDFNEVRSEHERSQLAIRGTLVNGEWISEPHRVKNEFFTHFKKQFSPPQTPRICFDFTFPTRLSSDQVEDLERIVTYDEVKRAVWDCDTNKSPGPDGFSFEFYRKYWTTIDEDVFQAVRDFFVNGQFLRGCNSYFIALIPKIQDAKFVKEFRPISLIGSVYIIIAKILANRLCLVFPYLISDVQSAFVSNRQILDGPFILNELLSWCKFKKSKGMIFKGDFEKAFDSVKWDYLDETLKAFGFGSG
ncbi:RNA-directed DNA polymerase, eukaryota [Tanacetum coccineum]|uniref:RNA-directed DNA polymerase, eukaryota n=1 Tax=Tanacetum coccineum TaxID=301880 RepID=A0ABQ4YTP6_9ASTR